MFIFRFRSDANVYNHIRKSLREINVIYRLCVLFVCECVNCRLLLYIVYGFGLTHNKFCGLRWIWILPINNIYGRKGNTEPHTEIMNSENYAFALSMIHISWITFNVFLLEILLVWLLRFSNFLFVFGPHKGIFCD